MASRLLGVGFCSSQHRITGLDPLFQIFVYFWFWPSVRVFAEFHWSRKFVGRDQSVNVLTGKLDSLQLYQVLVRKHSHSVTSACKRTLGGTFKSESARLPKLRFPLIALCQSNYRKILCLGIAAR